MKLRKQLRYTSRIIKASALLVDTKALLTIWNLDKGVQWNFDQIRRQNMLGKVSRKRLDDVLMIFRQRYFDDPDIGETLALLAHNQAPAQWIDPLLYFFTAQNDSTLRDMVIETLYPRKLAGYIDLPLVVVLNALRTWVAEHKTSAEWNGETVERVAQGILATLRDFGVLEGKVNKHIAPMYLPLETFAIVAFWLMQQLRSGKLVLDSPDWRLFFLDVPSVERYFIEAHQSGLLSYYAAGSTVRLEFPVSRLQEYANVIVERAR